MTSVDDLRIRLEREYLEPPTERTPQSPLRLAVDASTTTIPLTADVMSPDEEALIGPGSVMEVGYELLDVTGYTSGSADVIANRAMEGGGVAATHSIGDKVRIATRWPRQAMREAIEEAIEGLWQPLYVVKSLTGHTDSLGYVSLPTNAVRVVRVQYTLDSTRWIDVAGEYFAVHPLTGAAPALQLESGYVSALAHVRYAVQITAPSSVTATIVDLPPKWRRLVLTSAALELLTGVDLDAVTQELITETLQLERFPVRTGEGMWTALIRFREYLVNRFEKELRASSPTRVRMKDTVVLDL